MTLVSSKRVYSGRVIDLDIDTVQFPDGSTGTLEIFRHPGASAVIPFLDPVQDADPRVLLIRQFRHAANGPLWEIPAGRLDPGETPETCARRELEEEAGVTASHLERLTTIFMTPGFTDERIHLFLATGLTQGQHRREADEFMDLHTVRWSEIMRMIERGDISDGKTMVALFYADRFRHMTGR